MDRKNITNITVETLKQMTMLKTQTKMYEKIQESKLEEELIKQTIYHGNIVVALTEFPLLVSHLITFLCKTPADDYTSIALYHILDLCDKMKLSISEFKNKNNEHLLRVQPSYASLLFCYIAKNPSMEKPDLLLNLTFPSLETLNQEKERVDAIYFNRPSNHHLSKRSTHPNNLCDSDLISLDFIKRVNFKIENFHLALSRLEYLREHASLYFEYVAVHIYQKWMESMSKTITKRFFEIDQNTITRFQDIYPLCPLSVRSWKTDLVRTITTLSLPYLSAVLGIEKKEIMEGRHLKQLQMIDTKGIEFYADQFTLWHKQKILNDSFGNYELYHEEDVCGRNFFELPVEDIFMVKNQTHIYLFSKDEWNKLIDSEKNFHTNEPLSDLDLKLLFQKRSSRDYNLTATVLEHLKMVPFLKMMDTFKEDFKSKNKGHEPRKKRSEEKERYSWGRSSSRTGRRKNRRREHTPELDHFVTHHDIGCEFLSSDCD